MLSPITIVKLATISLEAKNLVNDYLAYTFDVNHLLRRFFTDPISFRAMQARTGAIISGSFAVQFFDRVFFPNSDLDLYTPYDTALEVSNWLETNGYFFTGMTYPKSSHRSLGSTNTTDSKSYQHSKIKCVLTFIRKYTPQEKVQIIVAIHSPISLILSFYASMFVFDFNLI